MKKITLLFAFCIVLITLHAQNLLVNPGFEQWADGKPTGWLFDKTVATISPETTIALEGTSLKVAATGTYWVTQNISVTPGKTYVLKLSYYIGTGDGTDLRIWSNFFNLSGTTESWATMSVADSLALKGPGGNTTTAYFANETSVWKNYEYEVTAPEGFTNFSFQVRVYSNATIYLDNFSFAEKTVAEPTPVVTTLWENGATTNKLPKWFLTNSNKTRGIGASNEHVFVATRDGDGGKNIFAYNALTGDSVAALNTTDLTLGTFVLNDVGVTEDGKIITASLGANTNFKVYMYDNLTSTPTLLLHIQDAAPGGRTGDLITVTGNYSQGTAKIFTATATAPSQIWVLEMQDGVWKTERTHFATMGAEVTGAVAACVAPKPDGSMYWKAAGQSFKLIKSDGSIDALGAGFSVYSNAIKYLGYSPLFDLDYVALFTYGGGKECAEIVSLTPGDLTTCKLIARTPSIGTNANAGGTGDIAVRFDTNDNPIIYMVSTNNGFGAYKVEGLEINTLTQVKNINNQPDIQIFPNPAKDIVNISETAKNIKLFSISGQLIKEAFTTTQLNVEGLQGVYFLQIDSDKGKVTKRLIVK
jgi:hypothetical protein